MPADEHRQTTSPLLLPPITVANPSAGAAA